MARSDENSMPSMLGAGLGGLPMEGVKYSISTRNPNPNRRALGAIENQIHGQAPTLTIGKPPQEVEVRDPKITNGVIFGQRPITRQFGSALESQRQSGSIYGAIGCERQQKRAMAAGQNSVAAYFSSTEMEVNMPSAPLMSSEMELVETTEVQQIEIEMEEINEYIEENDDDEEDEDDEIILDIDSPDLNNPVAVVEYVEEIHDFYRKTEDLSCVDPNYMALQPDINEKMRGILIDWLIEVHYKMELLDETIFLTVNLIDRFLALHNVARKKLQLVGVTALLLACKYEEVTVPVVEDLILICDRAYTRAELLQMEKLMVNTLQFNMSVPTPYVFMMRFLKAAQADKKLELLSFFMVELCLSEYKMLQFRPSLLAAAAIFTAQCTLDGIQSWSKCCEFHSRYVQEQLMECSRLMVELHQKAGQGKLTAVHRKFHSPKYGYVSKCEPALFLLDTVV